MTNVHFHPAQSCPNLNDRSILTCPTLDGQYHVPRFDCTTQEKEIQGGGGVFYQEMQS
jgi:hypothetical protein